MPEKAQELMRMAGECRDLAGHAKSETIREQLLETADQFERLATSRLERLRRQHMIGFY